MALKVVVVENNINIGTVTLLRTFAGATGLSRVTVLKISGLKMSGKT